jgi:hypothetical protein
LKGGHSGYGSYNSIKCSKEDSILYGRLAVIIIIISHLLKGRMALEL